MFTSILSIIQAASIRRPPNRSKLIQTIVEKEYEKQHEEQKYMNILDENCNKIKLSSTMCSTSTSKTG